MTDHTERKRQQRGEASRTALLEAGVELLREETFRTLLNVLGPRAVARRAMRSTGSFFYYWPSAEAYLDDLIGYIFRSGLLPENIDEVAENLEALAGAASDLPDAIRAICEANFVETVGDPFLAVEMLLRSQPGDDRIAAGLQAFYRDTERIIPVYERVAAAWQCEPLPPFDYETMSVALTALLEGLVLRHLVDPERVPPALYGESVLAFLTAILRRKDETAELRDRVTMLISGPPMHRAE